MTEPETGLTLLNKERPTLAQLVLINMPAGSTIEDANRLALKEVSNFEMIASMRPELLQCTPVSILLAVKQCISDGLTLSPSAGLVYLVPGSVNVGKDVKKYVQVLTYDPTANGRLSIARQAGRILDNKPPYCTFNGNGQVETVNVEFLVPSVPAPRWETATFTKNHFDKWRKASHTKNSRNAQGVDNVKLNYANPNYTSWNGGIDPEFAATKAIRHGLNRRGVNMNERRDISVQMDFKGVPVSAAVNEAAEEVPFTPHEIIESTQQSNNFNENDL